MQTNDSKITIIIAACVAIAEVIIILILVILLIRIRKNKQLSSGQEQEQEQEGNDFETANAFSSVISITSIEEDPFADDFKEYKSINQM